ncbi:MAG: DUF3368 domain-containing protein [Thermoguttaceae bacterium]
MIVVADTGPINYLVVVEAIAVLPALYGRVVLASSVVAELTNRGAPAVVRRWAMTLPPWVETRAALQTNPTERLGPGETEAIALAKELGALLLADETEARTEARRQGISVSGTVGILEKAAEMGLLDLAEAFRKLASTNFRVDPQLLRDALGRDAARRAKK